MKKRTIILIILVLVLLFSGFGFIVANKKGKDGKIHLFGSNKTYSSYKQGDIIDYRDGRWIVMYDSSTKDSYVTLFSTDIIYLGDDDITEALDGIYETSELNRYLKTKYIDSLGVDSLEEVNGYKVRLLNEDDLDNLTKYEYNENDDSYDVLDSNGFVCLTNAFYATMIDTDDYEVNSEDKVHLKYYNAVGDYDNCRLESITDDTTLFVRPVINLKKDALENK